MTDDEKHALSHRGRAFRLLAPLLATASGASAARCWRRTYGRMPPCW